MANQIRDARAGGWFWMSTRICTEYAEDLTETGIAVYAALCSFADNDTQDLFASYATIGKRAGVSRNTAIKWVQCLADLRLITVEPQFVDGRQSSNLITLLDVPAREEYSKSTPLVQQINPHSPVNAPKLDLNNTNQNNKDAAIKSFPTDWQPVIKELRQTPYCLNAKSSLNCIEAQIEAGNEPEHARAAMAKWRRGFPDEFKDSKWLVWALKNEPDTAKAVYEQQQASAQDGRGAGATEYVTVKGDA